MKWAAPTARSSLARKPGYSETAFAVAPGADNKGWRVRYFSPESEVGFCGHATIALGAALGQAYGSGAFALNLTLKNASIVVEAEGAGHGTMATLSSPQTRSQAVSDAELEDNLSHFGLSLQDLDPRLPPARVHGSADHIVLPLKARGTLAKMSCDLDQGRAVMRKRNLVTVMLVYIEDDQTFVARNAFASGGALEDPATGAAAAAFAGYLRDQAWPHQGRFGIRQGEDMGALSVVAVELDNIEGASVRVTGGARHIDEL